jgi:hypothetical protein
MRSNAALNSSAFMRSPTFEFRRNGHPLHLRGRRTIHEVSLLWRDWFDGLYIDGAATGRLMVLHLHP